LGHPLNRMAGVTRVHHEIEVADDCATLYLSGTLRAVDHGALTTACAILPSHVATLRLDLHGVDEVDDEAIVAVRAVLRYWRESRGGSFRLSLASERLVATYAEGGYTKGTLGLRDALPHIVEAGRAAHGTCL
jgi:hypothetical protein